MSLIVFFYHEQLVDSPCAGSIETRGRACHDNYHHAGCDRLSLSVVEYMYWLGYQHIPMLVGVSTHAVVGMAAYNQVYGLQAPSID